MLNALPPIAQKLIWLAVLGLLVVLASRYIGKVANKTGV